MHISKVLLILIGAAIALCRNQNQNLKINEIGKEKEITNSQ
jgi:hypothetical protein